jgi:hypothetical protein
LKYLFQIYLYKLIKSDKTKCNLAFFIIFYHFFRAQVGRPQMNMAMLNRIYNNAKISEVSIGGNNKI